MELKNTWEIRNDEETKQIVEASKEELLLLNDDTRVSEKADFFKALGDETRLKIIGMLLVSDLCMCEIVSGLEVPTSTVSHHLKVLERGAVIQSRKEGKFTIFSLNKEEVAPYLLK